MRAFVLFAAVAMATVAGCAADAGEDPVTADENAIVGGPLDWSHPAVGTLGACSATLVTTDVVLSSSGCHAEAFEVRDGHGAVAGTFRVAAEHALGDLVVVKLASPVPAAVASPVELAAAEPAQGARVTVLGFGCTGQSVEDTRKRSASVRWSASARGACPGAVVIDDAGRAVAVRATLVPPQLEAIRAAL